MNYEKAFLEGYYDALNDIYLNENETLDKIKEKIKEKFKDESKDESKNKTKETSKEKNEDIKKFLKKHKKEIILGTGGALAAGGGALAVHADNKKSIRRVDRMLNDPEIKKDLFDRVVIHKLKRNPEALSKKDKIKLGRTLRSKDASVRRGKNTIKYIGKKCHKIISK
jgi:hypothetical protein